MGTALSRPRLTGRCGSGTCKAENTVQASLRRAPSPASPSRQMGGQSSAMKYRAEGISCGWKEWLDLPEHVATAEGLGINLGRSRRAFQTGGVISLAPMKACSVFVSVFMLPYIWQRTAPLFSVANLLPLLDALSFVFVRL